MAGLRAEICTRLLPSTKMLNHNVGRQIDWSASKSSKDKFLTKKEAHMNFVF